MVDSTKYTDEQVRFILDRTAKMNPLEDINKVYDQAVHDFKKQFGIEDFDVDEVHHITNNYGYASEYRSQLGNMTGGQTTVLPDIHSIKRALPLPEITVLPNIRSIERAFPLPEPIAREQAQKAEAESKNTAKHVLCDHCHGLGTVPAGREQKIKLAAQSQTTVPPFDKALSGTEFTGMPPKTHKPTMGRPVPAGQLSSSGEAQGATAELPGPKPQQGPSKTQSNLRGPAVQHPAQAGQHPSPRGYQQQSHHVPRQPVQGVASRQYGPSHNPRPRTDAMNITPRAGNTAGVAMMGANAQYSMGPAYNGQQRRPITDIYTGQLRSQTYPAVPATHAKRLQQANQVPGNDKTASGYRDASAQTDFQSPYPSQRQNPGNVSVSGGGNSGSGSGSITTTGMNPSAGAGAGIDFGTEINMADIRALGDSNLDPAERGERVMEYLSRHHKRCERQEAQLKQQQQRTRDLQAAEIRRREAQLKEQQRQLRRMRDLQAAEIQLHLRIIQAAYEESVNEKKNRSMNKNGNNDSNNNNGDDNDDDGGDGGGDDQRYNTAWGQQQEHVAKRARLEKEEVEEDEEE